MAKPFYTKKERGEKKTNDDNNLPNETKRDLKVAGGQTQFLVR